MLNSLGGPCNHMLLRLEEAGRRGRTRGTAVTASSSEDSAAAVALVMEKRATSWNGVASRSWKGNKRHSPLELLEEMQLC